VTIGVLDRMALDEVGANPVRLADAIHAQLGEQTGPVPVEAIARSLDIVEMVAALKSIEGALITDPNRDCGAILVNQASGRQRQRFTVAHELGHFLSSHHVPTAEGGLADQGVRRPLSAARPGSDFGPFHGPFSGHNSRFPSVRIVLRRGPVLAFQ
jgi:hypothetical protein